MIASANFSLFDGTSKMLALAGGVLAKLRINPRNYA